MLRRAYCYPEKSGGTRLVIRRARQPGGNLKYECLYDDFHAKGIQGAMPPQKRISMNTTYSGSLRFNKIKNRSADSTHCHIKKNADTRSSVCFLPVLCSPLAIHTAMRTASSPLLHRPHVSDLHSVSNNCHHHHRHFSHIHTHLPTHTTYNAYSVALPFPFSLPLILLPSSPTLPLPPSQTSRAVRLRLIPLHGTAITTVTTPSLRMRALTAVRSSRWHCRLHQGHSP